MAVRMHGRRIPRLYDPDMVIFSSAEQNLPVPIIFVGSSGSFSAHQAGSLEALVDAMKHSKDAELQRDAACVAQPEQCFVVDSLTCWPSSWSLDGMLEFNSAGG